MDIEEILKDYVKDIISVVEIMKAEGVRRNPEQSWQMTLYKTGTIKEHELEYDFHGMGCWTKWKDKMERQNGKTKWKDKIIDFDFKGDVENKIFGVDPWFAAYYLRSLRLSGCDDLNFCQERISKVIEQLTNEGQLVKKENVYFYLADCEKLKVLEDETS